MKILKNERISAYTHGALVPVMAACAVLLVILSWSHVRLKVSLIIYGVSAIALFTASFLYHAMKRRPMKDPSGGSWTAPPFSFL